MEQNRVVFGLQHYHKTIYQMSSVNKCHKKIAAYGKSCKMKASLYSQKQIEAMSSDELIAAHKDLYEKYIYIKRCIDDRVWVAIHCFDGGDQAHEVPIAQRRRQLEKIDHNLSLITSAYELHLQTQDDLEEKEEDIYDDSVRQEVVELSSTGATQDLQHPQALKGLNYSYLDELLETKEREQDEFTQTLIDVMTEYSPQIFTPKQFKYAQISVEAKILRDYRTSDLVRSATILRDNPELVYPQLFLYADIAKALNTMCKSKFKEANPQMRKIVFTLYQYLGLKSSVEIFVDDGLIITGRFYNNIMTI
ncbi:MAG: hypothetical protein EOP45_19920 [Sphingobacteriaceae bacterium]|nr:MAG: hypothetical protein EOP45_19920 [Sphingobacteriaceae bacterium]